MFYLFTVGWCKDVNHFDFKHGYYVIVLNLLERVNGFGGRTQQFTMKCPAVLSPPNREFIKCRTQ